MSYSLHYMYVGKFPTGLFIQILPQNVPALYSRRSCRLYIFQSYVYLKPGLKLSYLDVKYFHCVVQHLYFDLQILLMRFGR